MELKRQHLLVVGRVPAFGVHGHLKVLTISSCQMGGLVAGPQRRESILGNRDSSCNVDQGGIESWD
jgi:hypothetical protein